MDIFHALLLVAFFVTASLFLREKKKRKLAEQQRESDSDRIHQLYGYVEKTAKAWILSAVPPDKVSYLPAEDVFSLNFVYPPRAKEMLVVRNPTQEERAIFDQVDTMFGGRLRIGEDFCWIQVPGPVTEEDRARYPKLSQPA